MAEDKRDGEQNITGEVTRFSVKQYNKQRLKIRDKLQRRYSNSGIISIPTEKETITGNSTAANPTLQAAASSRNKRRIRLQGVALRKTAASAAASSVGTAAPIESVDSKPARKVYDRKRREQVKTKYAGSEISVKGENAKRQRSGVYTADQGNGAARPGAAGRDGSSSSRQRLRFQKAKAGEGIQIAAAAGKSENWTSRKGMERREEVYSLLDRINTDKNAGLSGTTQAIRTTDKTIVVGRKIYVGGKKAVKGTVSGFRRTMRFLRAQQGKGARKIAAEITAKGARFAVELARKAIVKIVTSLMAAIAPILIAILVIFLLLSLVTAVIAPTSSLSLASYPSEDGAITETTLQLTTACDDLKDYISNIRSEPEWRHIDEVRYIPSLSAIHDAIIYDPFVLQAYLASVYDHFTAAEVAAEIQSLFGEMFTVNTHEIVEVRSRTVGGETEYYNYYILEVSMSKTPLEDIVAQRLEHNDEAKQRYEIYMEPELHGLHTVVYNPFTFDWTGLISCNYGWRNNPTHPEDGAEFHTGMDIAIAQGTPFLAGVTGTVTRKTTSGPYGNRIEITSLDGKITVLYAHMYSFNVAEGEPVFGGFTQIGTVGSTGNSTGAHLHIEVYVDGQRLDPLFMVSANI